MRQSNPLGELVALLVILMVLAGITIAIVKREEKCELMWEIAETTRDSLDVAIDCGNDGRK